MPPEEKIETQEPEVKNGSPVKADAEIIAELKKQLEDVTAQRDKFKTERDQANENLINMTPKSQEEQKSEFDEIFGGMR